MTAESSAHLQRSHPVFRMETVKIEDVDFVQKNKEITRGEAEFCLASGRLAFS
jgi:hypothetical protein